MIVFVRSLILLVVLIGASAPAGAEEAGPVIPDLGSRVMHYLDAVDGDVAERLLRDILSDESASIDIVSQLIRTGRTYQSQPVGDRPREQIVIRGQTYPLSLLIPQTYHASK
ncbi:MAG: hypothetical protein JNK03_13595, partial [Nitrospira sp.]|nr:hypothetical protein [Nitrospira sp.]